MESIEIFSSDYTHGSGCSCCSGHSGNSSNEITRRQFVKVTGTGAFGTIALSGLSWTALIAGASPEINPVSRKPLIVRPVLTYEVPERRNQTSWRNWGGIQTEKD